MAKKKKGHRAPKGSAERAIRDLGARRKAQDKRLKQIMKSGRKK